MSLPPIVVLDPMSPQDAMVPFTWDFSNLLATGDTIAKILGVTATPDGMTVGESALIAGSKGLALAVQAPLGPGNLGTLYRVTAEIVTASGITLARSLEVLIAIR